MQDKIPLNIKIKKKSQIECEINGSQIEASFKFC